MRSTECSRASTPAAGPDRNAVASCTGRAEDGTTIRVDLPDDAPPALPARWPPVGLTGPTPAVADHPADVVVALDPTASLAGGPADLAWARLESELALFAADHLVSRVAVHAGLATWKGRTVLLPGPSHVGKSTLVLALSDLGAAVHADEYALIDPSTGRASGWPRAVRRRRGDGGIDLVEPPSVARSRTAEPMAIDLVAILSYDPRGAIAGWRPIPTAEVVPELISNTVSAQRQPEVALDAALAIGRASNGIAGRRGEAAAAARSLAAILDGLGAEG